MTCAPCQPRESLRPRPGRKDSVFRASCHWIDSWLPQRYIFQQCPCQLLGGRNLEPACDLLPDPEARAGSPPMAEPGWEDGWHNG
jgi:hypothetical protein